MGTTCSCSNSDESKSNINLNPERIKELSKSYFIQQIYLKIILNFYLP